MRPHPRSSRRSNAAIAIALLALFIALGGPAQAKRLMSGSEIRPGTVTSRQIKDRSLTRRDLSRKTLRTLTNAPAGSVGAAALEDRAVTTRALAPGAVLTGTIADAQVTTPDLAPSAVTADRLAPDAVGQREIRPNGVGASELADNSVDGGEIIDGTLTARDVAQVVSAFEVDFEPLTPGQCQRAPVPIMLAGADVTGDLVLASPRTHWPPELDYSVVGTGAADAFAIWACNRSQHVLDAPRTIFNYAVLGF